MAVIGLDVGTTQAKCGVYGDDGKLFGLYSSEYPVYRDSYFQYADAEAMWQNVKRILFEAAKEHDIDAVCVTSFGESFVAVDKDFNILDNNIMLYTDPRGTEEAEELKGKISDGEAYAVTGNAIHAMYSLPKIMWVKKHKPQIYGKTAYFLPIAGFITYMLSGEAVTDYSSAARTMAFDVAKKRWSDRLIDLAEIDKEKLPKAVKSGHIAGTLKIKLAAELGIKQACAVVIGCHDQICSALGAGVLSSGSSVDGIGTVECITPVFDKQITDAEFMNSGFSCVPYAVDGMYATYMFNYSGGALIKWFRDKVVTKNTGQNFYEYYSARMRKDPTGLLVLPHFNGAATPYMDLGAKGAILNMDINTTAADIYKGIMEGCSFEMRLNAEIGANVGVKIIELTATGGGATSKEWLQIKADIMGVPVYPLESSDAGIAGCAMLAFTAIGKTKDLKAAARLIVKRKEPYLPSKERAERYDGLFEKYKKVYDLVKEVR